MNETPEVVPTPAAEVPTAPDESLTGTARDPEAMPADNAFPDAADDALAAIEQRPHPFA